MTFVGNIFLIGFMGTGKSAVAREIHDRYGMKLLEADALIAEKEGLSIPEIFKRKGEAYFRDLETDFLKSLKNMEHTVVSCGGGMALRSENVASMKELGQVVWLMASPSVILERVKGDTNRPLLQDNFDVDFIRALLAKRKEAYEIAADLRIDTDGKTIEEVTKYLYSNNEEAYV